MKKTIKFADDLSKLILEGKKTSTWRLFDDKNLKEGEEVDFINKQTMEKFGEATLVEVKETMLGKLTDEDFQGHQKYPSNEEMFTDLQKYYPREIVDEKTKAKIIKFKFNRI